MKDGDGGSFVYEMKCDWIRLVLVLEYVSTDAGNNEIMTKL